MIDESQKPTTQAYRDNWDRIWGPKNQVRINASFDRYEAPDGRWVGGEEVSRAMLPGEDERDCAARLLGLT